MDPLSSSEAFIKTLRGSSTSAEKIQVASEAWRSKSLYLPGRNATIVDWILQALIEDCKDSKSPVCITDSRYWTLLASVLANEDTKTMKIWLTPILARKSILPLLPMLIRHIQALDTKAMEAAHSVFRLCLPSSLTKANDDFVQNCFWAVLESLTSSGGDIAPSSPGSILWTLGLETFRSRFHSLRDKTKVHALFLSSKLSSWTLALHKTAPVPSLAALLYAAGEDILFNSQEALNSILKPSPTDPSSSKSSQNDFFHVLSNTIRQPSRDDADLLLPLLPRFFCSFLAAVPKHPLDLPEGFSKQLAADNKVKFAAMLFLGRASRTIFCVAGTDTPTELHLRLLKARVQLLEMLESESLMTSLEEAGFTLRAEVDFAREVLSNETLRTDGLRILTILLRFDHDLVEAARPDILKTLSQIAGDSDDAEFAFLQALLAHHAKSRTMNSVLVLLIDSLLNSPPGAASSGLLLRPRSLEEMQRCVHAFLSPSQTMDMVTSLVSLWTHLWHKCDLPGVPQDDLPTSGFSLPDNTDSLSAATALTLITRLIAPLLQSLPYSSLAGETLRQVQQSLLDLKNTFLDAKTLKKMVSKIESYEEKSKSKKSKPIQLGMLSALRLAFVFHRSIDHAVGGLELDMMEVHSTLSDLLRIPSILPELQIEIARYLLVTSDVKSPDGEDVSAVVDCLIASAEAVLESDQGSWDGQVDHLDSPIGVATAAVDFLLGRWLPVIEAAGSDAVLQSLASVIVRLMGLETDRSSEGFSPSDVLSDRLASGEFYEMKRLRVAIFTAVSALTEELDVTDISAVVSKSPTKTKSHTKDKKQLERWLSVHRAMLRFPAEYFTRSARSELTLKALALDVAVSDNVEQCTILRTLIVRLSGAESFGANAIILRYYLGSLQRTSKTEGWDAYVQVTLGLLRIGYRSAVISSKSHPDSNSLLLVLDSFQSQSFEDATRQAFLDVLQVCSDADPKSLSSEVRSRLDSRASSLRDWVDRQLEDPSALDVSEMIALLDTWKGYLVYHRMSSSASTAIQPVTKLIPAVMKLANSSALEAHAMCASFVSLLAEDIKSPGSDPLGSVGTLIAVFLGIGEVLTKPVSGVGGGAIPSLPLARSVRSWSPDQYGHVCALLKEHLQTQGTSDTLDLAMLLSLGEIILCNAPEGCGKAAHSLLERCAITLAGEDRLGSPSADHSLATESLSFVDKICTEKATLLRDIEAGHIFTILANVLSRPSRPSPSIFALSTNILVSLIRNQKDLVKSHFPDLTRTLGTLLGSLKGLGVEDASKLNRVLTNITTKTIAKESNRRGRGYNRNQKADSLGATFSMYATFVLIAYIKTYGTLSRSIRNALAEGIYGLCGLVGDHGRDWMYQTLNSDGRNVLKDLWAEYEKQRYTGTG